MVDLVVVKCIGSKNQSIRGKSWVPLLTFQERLLSITDFSKNRVARSLVFCVVFYRPFFVPFSLFLLAIALSVLLLTASDCPFAFFKLFSPTDLSQVTSFGWGEPSRWRIVRL